MLVNFSAQNYKSIKEKISLSMFASSLKEVYPIPAQAIFKDEKAFKILPAAAIYGANASGKSNLIDAMSMMKFYVHTSLARENIKDEYQIEPFLLSPETKTEPTEFEISFIRDNKLFRYGYLTTKDLVHEEWLFEKELKDKAKEKEIFYREKDKLEFHPTLFKVGKLLLDQNLIKKNVLVLSLTYQLNDDISKVVVNWFLHFNILHGHHDEGYYDFSVSQIQNHTEIEKEMQELIRFADVGVNELSFAILMDRPEIFLHHNSYNKDNEQVGEQYLLLSKQGSEGTRKLFSLSGPIFSSLKYGKLLVIDEMDSKLHPNLMEKLVMMFQDLNINRYGAQLIFASHNTNLLDARILRRDQIWITEKDKYGSTKLYTVSDFKSDKGKARNTEAIEQNYLDGKYGGTPFLGNLENFLEKYSYEQEGTKP